MALALLLATAPTTQAQVSGISYTVSPVGEYTLFESDNDSGLENGFLYGGELGFGFGRYLEASALYMRGDGFAVNFDDVALPTPDRDVDLRQYGGRVRLNLGTYSSGSSGFAPYLTGGAGILRFEPDNLSDTESIYVNAGVGVTLSQSDRYALTVAGQGLAYRYSPANAFFDVGDIDGDVDPGQVDVLVPSVRAALQVYLGGRDPDEFSDLDRAYREQFSDGLRNTRFFIEPFYGRVEFASELKGGNGGFYRDQNVTGINAGVNLGPYVGLRGFYWRGASGRESVFDDFASDFEPIAFYGGELNLRFGSSMFGQRSSFVPYGIIGGGYADVLSDYDNEIDGGLGQPDDRYFATLGGGLEVALADNISLKGGLRSLFMSSQEAENISDPDQVYANLMYTAGVSFGIGGGGNTSREDLIERRAEERERRLREATRTDLSTTEQALLDEIQRLQERLDELDRRQAEALEEARVRSEATRRNNDDAAEETESLSPQPRQRAETGDVRSARGGLTDRVVQLPVPEVGEIYVRIGETGSGESQVETSYAPPTIVQGQGVAQAAPQQPTGAANTLSREDISNIVSEELRRSREGEALSREEIASVVERAVQDRLASMQSGDADVAARNAQIRRLEDQIDDLRDDLRSEVNDLEQRQLLRERRGDRREIIVEGDGGSDGNETTRVVESSGSTASGAGFDPGRLTPMAGYSFGGAGRFLIGVRGDYSGGYRDIGQGGFRFMPEAAIGFGDGIGINLIANGVYDFDEGIAGRYLPDDVGPYAGAGVGLTTETGIGINLLAGLDYNINNRGSVFLEYSTMSFFDYNRVLVGYRVSF